MAFEKIISRGSGGPRAKEFLSIWGCGQIGLSKILIKDTNLKWAELMFDSETKRIGINFHTDETAPKGCYKIFGMDTSKNPTISGVWFVATYKPKTPQTVVLHPGTEQGIDWISTPIEIKGE